MAHEPASSQSIAECRKDRQFGQTMFWGCFMTRFRFSSGKNINKTMVVVLSGWCALLDCMTRETDTTVGQEPCEFHVFCYQLETLLI